MNTIGPDNQMYVWVFPIFHNPWDQSAPLARLIEVWPGIGRQCFDVYRYPDGYQGTEHDLWQRCDTLGEAVIFAEGLFT